jgi:hypothetical protein
MQTSMLLATSMSLAPQVLCLLRQLQGLYHIVAAFGRDRVVTLGGVTHTRAALSPHGQVPMVLGVGWASERVVARHRIASCLLNGSSRADLIPSHIGDLDVMPRSPMAYTLGSSDVLASASWLR